MNRKPISDCKLPASAAGIVSCFLAVIIFMWPSASIASIASDKLKSWISSLQWQDLESGNSIDVGASARNVIYAIGDEKRIYRWRLESGWQLLPGYFQRVAVDAEHKPWAIDQDGLVRRYNGLWWDLRGQFSAIDIGAGSEGSVVALDDQGKPYRWLNKTRSWSLQELSGHDWELDPGRRITVDSNGETWVVLQSKRLLKTQGDTWVNVSGTALDIAAGEDNQVVRIAPEGTVHLWAGAGGWLPINTSKRLVAISVGQAGSLWAINAQGNVETAVSVINPSSNIVAAKDVALSQDIDKLKARAVSADIAEVSEKNRADKIAKTKGGFVALAGQVTATKADSFSFKKIDGASAVEMAVGPQGSVFVLGSSGEIQRWQNSKNRFVPFPGVLKKLAVDPYGLPWGINSRGDVYRHVNGNWQQIRNITAEDIAIGAYGQVYVTSPAENIFQYNALKDKFDRVAGIFASKVAVTPKSYLWTVRSDGRIFQCQQKECTYRNRRDVVDIAIGPEGSVFISTTNGSLYRWQPEQTSWALKFKDAQAVGVGPGGYPWVTDHKNRVWRTVFFDRDESEDMALAQKTVSTTVDESTVVSSSITINKRLLFSQITNPSAAASSANLWLTASQADGTVNLLQTGGMSAGSKTWVNSYCLSYPTDIPCLDTDIQLYCPSPQGVLDPGCQDCNDPANQNTPLCSAYTGPGGVNGWNNGYCLFNPLDIACQVGPGQGCGQQISAACMDCSDPGNQLGTVCVLLNNDVVVSNSQVWQSSNTNYALRDYTKLPNNETSGLVIADDGRRWVIDAQNKVYHETSPGRGRYQEIKGVQPLQVGSNPRQIVVGGGSIYALNDAQQVFRYDSSSNRFIRYSPMSLFRRIAVSSNGSLWGIDLAGRLKRFEEGIPVDVPKTSFTQADEVAIGADGSTFIVVTINGVAQLLKYSATHDRFDRVTSSLTNPAKIAVDYRGRLWVLTTDAKIFRAR